MPLTAVQADIFLHHLEIQSSNPESLANFYSNIMDMKIDKLSSKKFVCEGPARKIIITLGENKTLSYAGMVCRNENNLNEFKEFLTANTIGNNIYYPIPLHLQECFEYLKYQKGDFPEAEKAAKTVISLPIFSELTSDELDYVCQHVNQFFSE